MLVRSNKAGQLAPSWSLTAACAMHMVASSFGEGATASSVTRCAREVVAESSPPYAVRGVNGGAAEPTACAAAQRDGASPPHRCPEDPRELRRTRGSLEPRQLTEHLVAAAVGYIPRWFRHRSEWDAEDGLFRICKEICVVHDAAAGLNIGELVSGERAPRR